MFPHCVNLLEAEWDSIKQVRDETGVSYRTRFKTLAGGLGRDPEGYKIKFVKGIYSPVMRKNIAMSSSFSVMDIDEMA